MREWQLPESLQNITQYHIEPVKAPDYRLETAIVHIASVITNDALADKPITPETLAVNPACWQITGLSIDDMPALKNEVDRQASMVMSLLFKNKKSA